jgi:hypothetical protein
MITATLVTIPEPIVITSYSAPERKRRKLAAQHIRDQVSKDQLAPKINAVLQKYGVEGTISLRRAAQYLGLTVTIRSGKLPLSESRAGGHFSVRPTFVSADFTGECREFITELLAVMNDGNELPADCIPENAWDADIWSVQVEIGTFRAPYKLIDYSAAD